MTPSTSAGGRFWLSLALASTRLMISSTPTMARSWPAMKGRRGVVDRPRARVARLVPVGQAADQRVDPVRVVVDD